MINKFNMNEGFLKAYKVSKLLWIPESSFFFVKKKLLIHKQGNGRGRLIQPGHK